MDSDTQKLIRAYRSEPGDIDVAGRLIAALLRERGGEGDIPWLLSTGQAVNGVKTAIAFFISCQTGCSCCNDENHFTGPYRSLSYTKEVAEGYTESRRLASQYARNGIYEICWSEVEILPDGRITDEDENRIFDGFSDDPDFDGHNESIDRDYLPNDYNVTRLPDWYADPLPIKTVTVSELQQ